AAPTTAPDRVNLKLYLMNPKGVALSGYAVTIGDNQKAIANKTGTAYFSNIDPDDVATLRVYDGDEKERGRCKVDFTEGKSTAVAVHDDVYTITYKTGTQDVYMSADIKPDGSKKTEVVLKTASDKPLKPGKPADKSKDEKGHEKPEGMEKAPCVNGYLIDAVGAVVSKGTVESLNTDTKGMLSDDTDSKGFFEIAAISKGKHKITATASDGKEIGFVKLEVKEADATGVAESGGKLTLSIAKGAKEVYMNLKADGKGGLIVSDVSDVSAVVPAAPSVAPTAAAAPTSTVAPVAPVEHGGGVNMILVIVLIIAAAAVVVLAVFLYKRSKRQ
ncbi:MAG: carboxypeptidase-like regulatory domain-containing protein, partial [Christensenella sp.]